MGADHDEDDSLHDALRQRLDEHLSNDAGRRIRWHELAQRLGHGSDREEPKRTEEHEEVEEEHAKWEAVQEAEIEG